jgi:hypothetical protein
MPVRRRIGNETIDFEVIPLDKVPSRPPIAKPSSNPRGSQWDEILEILEQKRGRSAVQITIQNPNKRPKLKSTLQTIAKNRNSFVEVRDGENPRLFYAWVSEKTGRFSTPGEFPA